jgi:predicted transcriptional regulator
VGESPISHIRFDEVTRQRLAEAAEADDTTPSAIVREAVQAWLNDRPHAVGE